MNLQTKKHVDDSTRDGNDLRFNQTLEKYLKVSVGNDIYNLTKYDKTQITDSTKIKYPKTGAYLFQNWGIKCNDKNNSSKIQNFMKSTQTGSLTGYSGATSLPPVGNSFLYTETSSNNHGNNVFISFERTDIFQNSNITFYYNRFSILTISIKSMGCFRIQLLLEDNTWSTQYNITKIDRYSNSSTDWTKLSVNFTVESYVIRLVYDQKDTSHANMCFSDITLTQSVY